MNFKEEIKNCFNCSHQEVCKSYNDKFSNLLTTEKDFDSIGKKIAKYCKYFDYKEMKTYLMNEFKEVLKEKIENTKNANCLLVIDSIFNLLGRKE